MNLRATERRLVCNTPLCTGCRACEIACSFYLKGICDPMVSKIKIIRDNETGEIFCDLPLSCPECDFEDEPPCVSFCEIGALRMKG